MMEDEAKLIEHSLEVANLNGRPRPGTRSALAYEVDKTSWVSFADETPVQPDELVFLVEDQLILSSEYGAISAEVFDTLKIGAVVNLVPGGHTQAPDMFKGRPIGRVSTAAAASVDVIEYLSIQVHDQAGEDLQRPLAIILPAIDAWHAQNRRVLVHCSAGLSRSVSIILAFLMKRRGLSLAEAVEQVTRCRGRKLQCNAGFWMQLVLLERELLRSSSGGGGSSGAAPPPSLDVSPWIIEDTKRYFEGDAGEAPEGTEERIAAALSASDFNFDDFMSRILG